MKTILFQGDSITDAFRNREDDIFHGSGYPAMVSGQLGLEFPSEYTFLNRGISGNRIIDVYARIKSDIINLKPDYMSLLIGVNDVWHELLIQNGIDAIKYEKLYNLLIEELLESLPNLKLIILEPFVLSGTATEGNWDIFNLEVRKRANISMKIAEKFNMPFVSLQDKFDEAVKSTSASYWLHDGVHPTASGHALITKEWIHAFKTFLRR
jgi:lysophospholipase L1-like esterase